MTNGNPLAIIAVFLAWSAFGFRVFQLRRKSAAVPSAERSDATSWLGIVLQGVAIGVAFFGPTSLTGSWFGVADLATAALPTSLALGGFLLFDAAGRELGRNWSLVARVREDHALVTTGPFALTRNPIYLAMLMMTLAAGFALGHLIHLLVAVPLFILATAMRVAREERLLREQFGAVFDDYAARVPRLIPGIW
ncbi:MAG: isoprenylcysteine carboxylmethyltransferase family protein [Alphaproteobacteria bacterium]|nr:isoprenylcysteine carboxylmethyltransferase family protein [Alphaproteobacteria bacterium]